MAVIARFLMGKVIELLARGVVEVPISHTRGIGFHAYESLEPDMVDWKLTTRPDWAPCRSSHLPSRYRTRHNNDILHTPKP